MVWPERWGRVCVILLACLIRGWCKDHGLSYEVWQFCSQTKGFYGGFAGVTHGSASLMRHVTSGTLESVTKLASSVARNLDRFSLDEEHVRRTEEQRRLIPQGLTQGFLQVCV